MSSKSEEVMQRGVRRLHRLHAVIEWLIVHWRDIPDDLHKLENDESIPVDVREELISIVREDLANGLTVASYWREFKEGGFASGERPTE